MVDGCLVGKVLLNREVKIVQLKATLQQVWKTIREVQIEEMGDNIFILKFGIDADKRNILAGLGAARAWHFNRALIVLVEPSGIGEVTKQAGTHASFWVQIHNVPIMCMNDKTIKEIGEEIEKVEEVGTNVVGECFGKFLRLRIQIDVTKPLIKVLELKDEDVREEENVEAEDTENENVEGEDIETQNRNKENAKKKVIFMSVLYERLPDFCFVCGCIGHQYRECT